MIHDTKLGSALGLWSGLYTVVLRLELVIISMFWVMEHDDGSRIIALVE